MNNTEQIIIDFNDTLMDFAMNLAKVCNNSLISDNIQYIKSALKTNENKTKFIDTFVTKILPYKTNIDNENEKEREEFFLNKSYDDDANGDKSTASKIFEFKKIWKTLSKDNKDCVIQYMQILCEISSEYYNNIIST